LVLAAGVAWGDDWPQWLGPERDGVWRETGVLQKFPEGGPKIRWRTPVAVGYAGPAVAGGKVFVTDHVLASGSQYPKNQFQPVELPGKERVLCLNEADGKELWKHEYDCPYKLSYPYGPRTTPVVKDGSVYTLGAEGHLFCLDLNTGKPRWSHDFKKEYGAKTPLWGFSAHPLLDGPRLVCMVGGEGSIVVAFDKDSGKELWRALSASQPGYCPPMIYEAGGRRQLVVWDAENLSGLDPETGKVYWSQPAKTYMAMSIATPRKQGDELFTTAAMGFSMMVRLDPAKPTAEVLWQGDKKTGLSSVFSTPFFEDGYVYGSSGAGELVCIKADTGTKVWGTFAPNHGKKLDCGDAFLVKNGDRFFLATEQGDLIIAKLSPKGYEEISRAHILEPTSPGMAGRIVVWSHPAFANRCAYMRNDKEIVCVSLAE
jgi:outer membrane protein assembly factor BamB